MKALVILLAILAGVWIWRSGRGKRLPASPPPPADASTMDTEAQPMVACRVCGVHVPPSEAVVGHEGSYCCPAHRQQAEG